VTRTEQVEHLLKNQDTNEQAKDNTRSDTTSAYVATTISQGLPESGGAGGFLGGSNDVAVNFPESISPGLDAFQTATSNMKSADGDFPWEMIGLGLDEPLPPQDVIDDL
jgi:hypothetical protein